MLRFSDGDRIRVGTFDALSLEHEGLFDGCERGKRYPHPRRDDDGDGSVDEDPLDGMDNDGDGSIDEDFAAIGDEMFVTVGVDRGTGLVRRQSSYTWTFGHVRDFIGFTTTILYPSEGRGLLSDLEAVLYLDFDIGGAEDPSRGANDCFYAIGREWEGGTLCLPAARGNGRYAALLLLGAIGPHGERLESRTLIARALDEPAELLRLEEGAVEENAGRLSGRPPISVLDSGRMEGETAAATDSCLVDGDGAILCLLEGLPEFWPGDELTVHWALVFGSSERKLIRNALRALETFDGVPDGEGAIHRWIVPARRAGRIELEAEPAFVWSRGRREPAAAITLPPRLEDEEIEWLRGLNAAVEYQQAGGKVLITTEEAAEAQAVFVEGQMTDGTIFTTTIACDDLVGTEEAAESKENLPEKSIQLYPNPFLTNLNISIHIFDAALTEGTGGSSSVRIYDVRGRLVRTVLDETSLHPGEYQRAWDGLDEYGNEAAPGVYYVKLQIGDRSVTKRVILLR